MADQNTDPTKPIASGLQPGPTEHLATTTSGLTSAAGSSGTIDTTGTTGTTVGATGATGTTGVTGAKTTSTGSQTGSSVKESAAALTAKATDTVKQSTVRIAEEAKQYAGDMANLAKDKSRTLFDQQKDTAIGKVDSVVNAIRSTAQNLQGDQQQQQIGRYINMAADKLEEIGGQLRNKNLDTLIDDAQNFARRSPTAFFAGTVVAGFLLSRFLKSSAERRREYDDTTEEQFSARTMPTGDTYTAQGEAYSASTDDLSSAYRTSGVSGTRTSGTSSGLGIGADGTTAGATGSTLNDTNNAGDTYGNR